MQDQYQVVVDLNIGAFPLGRVGAIKCNNQGEISLEDEICITLAHLFKHEYAYMKDINDLFYYFHAHEFSEVLLLKKVKQYHLELELSTFLHFMNRRYYTNIPVPLSLDDSVLEQCHFEQWPFSRESHFLLKNFFCKRHVFKNSAKSPDALKLNLSYRVWVGELNAKNICQFVHTLIFDLIFILS